MGWKLPTLAAALWVIALTVVGAALGVLITGPEGVLIGAIPLALGTVLAGYVPTIRDAVHRRQDELARLARAAAVAQERWDAVGEPAMEAVESGPAALLRPDRAVVQFIGREDELRVLQAWCVSEEARSVRIIVGAGGIGKTRLALRVASEWESRGYEWRRIDLGQEREAVAAARGVTSAPVLLMVDYAETRTELEAMFRAVLGDPGPIRALLVARDLGEWWDRLIEKSPAAIGRLLTKGEPIRLAEQITHESSDADLVAEAVPQFARALRCLTPDRIEFELPPRRVPVLVLHTAALIAVLRSRDNPATSLRVMVAEGLLDELLEHEARYWRRAAGASGLPEDGPLLKAVVASAALLGAANLAETAALAARVPDLAYAPQVQQRSWARWLYGLYPADPEGRLGSLQPDLLAETHVVKQLASDTDLATACLRDLTMTQAVTALTVLARAWAHQDEAERLIAEALHTDLAHLALPAAVVALQTNKAVGKLLATALREAPVEEDVLVEVAEVLPYPSVALSEAHLAATWRVWRSLPPDAEPFTLAEWSDRVGRLFLQLGSPARAVPVLEEAVALYRELAAANPDQYRSNLADSLDGLGTALVMMGRAEAIPALNEAIVIYRELAAADPDRYRPALAGSLNNLGATFGDLGRPADALPVEQEAVAIRRELVAASADRYRSGLASSLNNLGNRLSELGRPAEALPVAEEAAAIRRGLAAADPDRYRPDFAQSLSNLANRLDELGRPVDARPIAEEAAAIRRELAAAVPDRYRFDLAQSLNNLGIIYTHLGRPADAVVAGQEAVAIRRELAAATPDRHRADLAQSLNNLGNSLTKLGRALDALPIAEEATAIYRELAAAVPDRHRADLAQSLNNLGNSLTHLGRPHDAVSAEQEALAIWRELAPANPDRYRPSLADTLNNLGNSLTKLGRPADALPPTEEAVAIRRQLATANPDRYRPDLATSLTSLAAILSALGRHPEAEQLRSQANILKNGL